MKRILFVCVANSCRSQMAEGFARSMGSDVLEVGSGGTAPARRGVNPLAVAVMWERHIEIGIQKPKSIDLEFAKKADMIITMGCRAEDACPAFLLPKVTEWDLEDPVGKPVEVFRRVRDQIEQRVGTLVAEARIEMPLAIAA